MAQKLLNIALQYLCYYVIESGDNLGNINENILLPTELGQIEYIVVLFIAFRIIPSFQRVKGSSLEYIS